MVCMIVLATSLFTVLLPSVIEAVDCKGCVDLDSTSFEKVFKYSNFLAIYRVTLVFNHIF